MMRYARAAIGLVAAIFVAAFIHGLMAPRLGEGAYGGPLDGGWLTFIVDLLAFGGTWVTVAGVLANRAVGRVLESLLEGTGHAVAPTVGAQPAAVAAQRPAPAQYTSEPAYQGVPWPYGNGEPAVMRGPDGQPYGPGSEARDRYFAELDRQNAECRQESEGPQPRYTSAEDETGPARSDAQQLAANMADRSLIDGDAEGYLRAFRLLHPGHDTQLIEAMPGAKPAGVVFGGPEVEQTQDAPKTTRKRTTTRGSK